MSRRKLQKSQVANKTSSLKGRLVEQVVASLHKGDDVKVERNVFLPAIDSTSRKREIDVLITPNNVEGESLQLFVECKNYKDRIDVPLIDAFVGKLHDIGIPTQQGVFVSIKAFTKGALERASKAGIKTLLLTALTDDRLAVKKEDAEQYVIFLLATITQFSVLYEEYVPMEAWRTPFLFNEEGHIRYSYFDLFWKEWCQGAVPSVIGSHQVSIDLGDGYFTPVGNQLKRVEFLTGTMQVEGLVMAVSGQAQQHLLVNQVDMGIERLSVHASFVPPKGTHILVTFRNEEELQNYIEQQKSIFKVSLGRTRLPRIKASSLYWPLSERVGNVLFKEFVLHRQNSDEPFNIESCAHYEGTDIKTSWEPIWDQNPILREIITPSTTGDTNFQY